MALGGYQNKGGITERPVEDAWGIEGEPERTHTQDGGKTARLIIELGDRKKALYILRINR